VTALLLTFFLLATPALAAGPTGCVDVTIDKVRSGDGVILLAFFGDEASYKAQENAIGHSVPAKEGTVAASFCDLPPGRYALSVFHDANSNKALDTNGIGVPREGYGFSNGQRGRTGPPKFEKLAFDVTAGGTHAQQIRLLYWM
jgi:uncharacterized protein (DUF2141 family)